MGKIKSAMISSSLVQDQEFVYPFYRLLEEGFELDIFLLENTVTRGFLGSTIPPNKDHPIKNFNELKDESSYDLLVLPGGVKSMEKIRLEQNVINFIYNFNKKKKVIASICSAAQLLISAKIVSGRKVSGYYSMMDDIINAGAQFVDGPYVIDDNLITSPHYKYVHLWMKETIRLIKSRI